MGIIDTKGYYEELRQLGYLIWEVFGVWRGEAYPHVRINHGDSVQEISETQASLLLAVHRAETPTETGNHPWGTDLRLRHVPVAVHVLP